MFRCDGIKFFKFENNVEKDLNAEKGPWAAIQRLDPCPDEHKMTVNSKKHCSNEFQF
jgi:hypothetical protein